jgi:hypothetical protein
MFGKRNPPLTEALAARVRKLAGGAASAVARHVKFRDPRAGVFRDGTLILPDGERMSVAIKDLSQTGARIEFVAHRELPLTVMLSEPMLKLRRTAKVIWQRDCVAGLSFD